MAIHLLKRGEVYYAGGTVRVGKKTVAVPRFSTGCSSRDDALAVASAREAEVRQAALDGPSGRARRLTVADCAIAYMARPRGVSALDKAKLRALLLGIGAAQLDALRPAWGEWLAAHRTHAPGTLTRTRALLMAAIRHGCDAHDVTAPSLPAVSAEREARVAMLTQTERTALLSAYSPAARRPVLLLAHQGMRTQEVLRLDWRDVDVERQVIRAGVRSGAARTKARRGRALPMHPEVLAMLDDLWTAAGKPQHGPVFLSSRGEPYADTTDKGGNPLRKAHATACRRAGVSGFRVHDLRHDWASRMVMGGVDLFTLMKLGGWASLAMVERYAAVSADHLRDAMRRIA